MSAEDKQTRKNLGQPSPEDFAYWEERAREMTVPELWAARLDCIAAAKAMRLEPISGWYTDESSTYAREMNRRQHS